MCVNITDGGYLCGCYAGYTVSPNDTKQCVDVDECALGTHRCSQICNNINGSHYCSCRDGFELVEAEGGVCKALDPNVTLILSNG